MLLAIAASFAALLALEREPTPAKTYVTGFVAALQEHAQDIEYFRYQSLWFSLWWRTSDPEYLRRYTYTRESHKSEIEFRAHNAKRRQLAVEVRVLEDLAERAKRKQDEAAREVERVKRELREEQRQQKKNP